MIAIFVAIMKDLFIGTYNEGLETGFGENMSQEKEVVDSTTTQKQDGKK